LNICKIEVILDELVCLGDLSNCRLVVHHLGVLNQFLGALSVDCLLILALVDVWKVWKSIVLVFLHKVYNVFLLDTHNPTSRGYLLSLG